MNRRPRTEKNFTSETGSAMTAVARLNRIFKKVEIEGLSEDAANELADDIRSITVRFDICPKAAVLLAAIMEKTNSSDSCDEEDLAGFIGCTNLEFINFHDALHELEDKSIVARSKGRNSNYKATPEAMRAVEKDCEFVPVKTTGLGSDELFSRMRRLIMDFRDSNIDCDRLHDELVGLIDKNGHLLFCRKISESPLWSRECTNTERRQFLYICHRYVAHGNRSVPIDILMNFTEFLEDEQRIRRHFANGRSGLQTSGLVTFSNENGFVDNEKLSLSDEVRATFFDEIELAPEEKVRHKNIIPCESIKEQELFYNKEEGEAVERLASLLQEENYKAVQERLGAQGMPKGFSCIFHGCAGSGKTATLKALARRTGRDLFWVDLSSIKSKWVGESEKQVKALFDTYRNLVRTSKRAPILAVNEADAMFTKRITNVEQSTDQMNNAITDIILNELETLDGILIATTNLVGNMMDGKDNAMERRFLFKVEFNAPDEGVREKIWKSKLPHLGDGEARILASKFKLSGGSIDNVARKSVVDYVLSGSHADLATLLKYCGEESITCKNETRRIGFKI
jgi:hypothetical protein